RELALVLADMRAGEPFTTAMERLAVRGPVPAVVRFVDGVVVAPERGTPLGDVLRAQAADVREQHKRDLIEAGGRREVLMLVPSSIGLDDRFQGVVSDRRRAGTWRSAGWCGRCARSRRSRPGCVAAPAQRLPSECGRRG